MEENTLTGNFGIDEPFVLDDKTRREIQRFGDENGFIPLPAGTPDSRIYEQHLADWGAYLSQRSLLDSYAKQVA